MPAGDPLGRRAGIEGGQAGLVCAKRCAPPAFRVRHPMSRLPPSAQPGSHARRLAASFARGLPTTPGHWLSVIALWAVFISFFVDWTGNHWLLLADPDFQNDDARTAIFPYHRWGAEGALANDPIAREMLTYQPLFVKSLYFVLVPLTNLFVATKLVQLLCIAIILAAGWLLIRAPRFGLMAGLLLVFVFLRDWWVVNRLASGLPRAFAFPCIALWFAGALTASSGVRRVAVVLSALTYPSALAMLLAGEGLFAFAGVFAHGRAQVLSAARHYAVTLALAMVAVLPTVLGGDAQDGSIHTLAEANAEPAFGMAGRLRVLPFADPRQTFAAAFASTFLPQGERPLPTLVGGFDEHLAPFAFVLIALLIALSLSGISAAPQATTAFVCGAAIMYFVATVFAFRFYSPERFYAVGMRIGGALLLIEVLAALGDRWRAPWRPMVRNWVAALTMLALWLLLGNGNAANLTGANISRATHRPLTEFLATLPLDSRIAGHPMDVDDIPLWSARATMGGFETLQPWLKGSWQRQKARTEGTLRALYATDPAAVLAYAHQNGVTHFLIRDARYQADFIGAAKSFEPFDTFVRQTFGQTRREDLVFAAAPPQAVVFREGPFAVLSTDLLEQSWSRQPSGPPP